MRTSYIRTLYYRLAAIGAAAALLGIGTAAASPEPDTALSALLKQQTQSFSEAGQNGNAATIAHTLDPDVVFTNETGAIATRQEVIDGTAKPPAGAPKRRIEVTDWALHRQGPMLATATFIDQVTVDLPPQTLVLRFQSSETWIRRPDGWKMLVSQTMNVVRPPQPIALPASQLAEYIGTYRLGSVYTVSIARDGNALSARTNGAAAVPLAVEVKDVLFSPAAPTTRRIFQRDAAGRIRGYINRRDGADLYFTKVG